MGHGFGRWSYCHRVWVDESYIGGCDMSVCAANSGFMYADVHLCAPACLILHLCVFVFKQKIENTKCEAEHGPETITLIT